MATDELARQAVDAIEGISGHHPGFRAAHAKGTLCAATLTPTADAAHLTRAAHFRDGPMRAHVRFSNGSGNPNDPDFEPREARGMATKFYLDDGTTTDIIGITLPAFFVGALDGFFDFCRARTPDAATGEPDPAAIGAFLEQHPEALTAGAAALSATPPESYLRCAYNSLHA
jgi:catalase